jgi:hypothetical protein
MADALKGAGRFWWFTEELDRTASIQDSVFGNIKISEQGDIELNLEGGLWYQETPERYRFGEPRPLPNNVRIAGRLENYGEFLLLEGLERTDLFLLADQPVRHSYNAARCYTCNSAFPKDFFEKSFKLMRIKLLGLDEWLKLGSIRVVNQFSEGDETEVRIYYRDPEIMYETPIAAVSIENIILGIPPFGLLSDAPERELNIRQTDWLVYTPKERSGVNELLLIRRRIEELISLLLGTYFSLDWPVMVAQNDDFDAWYKLYFHRGTPHHSVPPSYLLWTTFPSVRDSFGQLLYRWQEMVQHYGAGYELYIAPLQDPLLHAEHRFVNLVWAIESLHRNWQRDTGESTRETNARRRVEKILGRFDQPVDKKDRQWLEGKLKYAHQPTLEQRIVEAFARLPVALDTAQLRAFAARCAARRNDISHEGGRRPGEAQEDFYDELWGLTDALAFLFHALVLHEIGVSSEVLGETMTRSGLAEMRILPALREAGIYIE